MSYGVLSLSRMLPVVATIHHPMTVDRRIAVNSTRSYFKKLQQLRWYSFIGMQIRVAKRLKRLITVSEWSKADISKEFGIRENKFITVPNGIDTTIFHPVETIRPETGRLITTNSADTPLKGLYYLLYAIDLLRKRPRQVKLVVIGEPKKNSSILRLIKRLNLSSCIQFTGRIDQQRFIQEYARACIAVVPSVYEGFGLPVGEAMACRIPVVCTTGGALPEVAGNAAKLVPPKDPKALADAIEFLLDSPKEREHLAETGYKRVLKEFSWEMTAVKTVKAYQDVIHAYR